MHKSLDEAIASVSEVLPCEVSSFTCRYLGLPLSIRKLTKTDLQPIVDKLADLLHGWKAAMLSLAGCSILVKGHPDCGADPFAHYIGRAQVAGPCHRQEETCLPVERGGHCLVGGTKAYMPTELRALGIHNLEVLGWALHMRWLWLRKTKPDRP
ncbi:hypothetical protein U9M48_040982 [Paspalum notatum var. saurae]|uniref:Uncharacterized protein n=1 Tax=Paspalum notatum var. saurae TaxID=547442 RepID=A0AAQ3XEC2_PASNO